MTDGGWKQSPSIGFKHLRNLEEIIFLESSRKESCKRSQGWILDIKFCGPFKDCDIFHSQ